MQSNLDLLKSISFPLVAAVNHSCLDADPDEEEHGVRMVTRANIFDPTEATCEVCHLRGLERRHKVQLRSHFTSHKIVTVSELTKVRRRNAAEMHTGQQ